MQQVVATRGNNSQPSFAGRTDRSFPCAGEGNRHVSCSGGGTSDMPDKRAAVVLAPADWALSATPSQQAR